VRKNARHVLLTTKETAGLEVNPIANKILTYLAKKGREFPLSAAIALVVLVGYADYLTGVELSLAIFYLLPVAIVAWFANKWNAYAISALGAVTWFFMDVYEFRPHVYPFVPYWNALVRLGIFLIFAYIITRLKQSLESDLALAAEIQQGFLPRSLPATEGLQISGSTIPCQAVSGDYFDVIEYSDTQLGVCIADVVGHGVPAAILRLIGPE
jgi:hypothetical protein